MNNTPTHTRSFALAITALTIAATLGMAQTAPDAVTADAKHYTVEFENPEVRVLRIKYPAHEKGNMHSHPCSVTVFLTDATIRMTRTDGTTGDATITAGRVVWENGGAHQPENIGNQPFEAVRIEFKSAAK